MCTSSAVKTLVSCLNFQVTIKYHKQFVINYTDTTQVVIAMDDEPCLAPELCIRCRTSSEHRAEVVSNADACTCPDDETCSHRKTMRKKKLVPVYCLVIGWSVFDSNIVGDTCSPPISKTKIPDGRRGDTVARPGILQGRSLLNETKTAIYSVG